MEPKQEQTPFLTDDEADRETLEGLFRAHFGELVAFASRHVGPSSAAEDLVQDVFFAIWKNRAAMRDSPALRAYLYRATYNRCLNALRHQRIERDLAPPPIEESLETPADERLIAEETDLAIRRAVGSLPERCQLIFRLSRENGLTYSEIALVAGVSIKTVETQMGRALRSLREQLAPLRD